MDALLRSRLLSLAIIGATATMAVCTGGSKTTASPSRPRAASASPAVQGLSPRASDVVGTPIDVSALGGRIVFSNATEDIWMVNADGSGLQRLTTNSAHDFAPALSPDGKQIAFRSERDGNSEVYVMDADGSGQHDLSNDSKDDWGPTWSPDGRVLWNCVRGTTISFQACLVAPDPGGTAQDLLPIDIYVEYQAWSPDGSRIAFMSPGPSGFTGSDPAYDIYVVNADGSGLEQLTDDPGQDGFPSWSPDGTKLAFSSTRDDCSNSDAPDCRTTGDIGPYHTIYVMNADGTDQHRISLRFGMFVDWSPDGNDLVFSPGLNVIRPDGTGLNRIPVSVAGDLEFADWAA
jgi:Tol biopolymer transport system component